MSKLWIFSRLLCIFILAQPSFADTEFEGSIPVETVKALFNTYGEENFLMYSDIAEAFPEFSPPDGFSVVGSVSQMSTLRIIFQTGLSEDEAVQRMQDEFESREWIQFPMFQPPTQQVGFISPRYLTTPRRNILCHDEHGNMTITYFTLDSLSYLSIGVPRFLSAQQSSCEQQIQLQQSSMGQVRSPGGLRQYLPRMEIPESQTIQRRPAFISGGSSMSGNSIETDGFMTSDEGIDEIYEFFAEQIQSQAWELDSESVGSRSASGTWIKSPEPDLNLVGTLSIIDLGDDEFELRFRMAAEGFTSNSIFTPFRN